MKTYKKFITELNKFELALKAGKLGLKTLKKIGLKSTTKKVPIKDIIKFRNNPKNPFTSMRRSAENQLRNYQSQAPGQLGPNIFRNKYGDPLFYDTTLGRHTDLRNVGKKFNRQAYADMKHSYLDGDKNAKKVMDAIKDAGDANRQLSKPPMGTTPVGTRPNEMMKLSFPRTIEKRKMADLMNKEKLGIEPKYGDKPTTKNIKKGSIPEPKTKKDKNK
tara:strand:+ start:75 stop:728 length:654 start_codon:yes stop_codon:yes gene_type:complete